MEINDEKKVKLIEKLKNNIDAQTLFKNEILNDISSILNIKTKVGVGEGEGKGEGEGEDTTAAAARAGAEEGAVDGEEKTKINEGGSNRRKTKRRQRKNKRKNKRKSSKSI
jgi:hypothetical protein